MVMWPQYHLDVESGMLAGAVWLVLGVKEAWVANIAIAAMPTSKPSGMRDVVTELRRLWLPRFQNAFRTQRGMPSGGVEGDARDKDADDMEEEEPEEVQRNQVCRDAEVN